MFTIEKGIAIPAVAANKTPKYPFAGMEIGDSFLLAFPDATDDAIKKTRHKAFGAAAAYQKKVPGIKFKIRRVDGGMRIWRAE